MLQLQRASAGSGKTFTLAKKFIWFLIAIKEEGKPWRLRNRREIADGLPRILAITFTNKATNEMKQRIVEKLSDLAKAASPETLGKEEAKKIAYLNDFVNDLKVEPQAIGESAKYALFLLLNQYSDFHVSTIDSFFQTILRTFAYESNLNDSYQVEIDDDFLTEEAVDATLDTVDASGAESPTASFWLELLMDEASAQGNHWNAFQKSDNRNSIYYNLRASLKKLASEDFKEVRRQLDEYFENDPDALGKAYVTIKTTLESRVAEPLQKAKDLAADISALLKERGIDPKEGCLRYFDSHLLKLKRLHPFQTSKDNLFSPIALTPGKSIFKKGFSPADGDAITEAAIQMYEAYNEWTDMRNSREWVHWQVYAPLLPYLGLLSESRKRMKEFLDANNLIQLGETSSMLQRIISDDDTPFIYERLGTSINHYLIDEFQDTSRLQWDNLRPLLMENDSRGEDNLIIGDAKQSIYRFRNADPSLITTTVPENFPTHKSAGMSKEENTNWRSARRIVEFNNFFFHALAREMGRARKEKEGKIDFVSLYRNVAQYPSHRENEGYVEIRFFSADASDSAGNKRKEATDSDAEIRAQALSQLGPLISSILARGYSLRDIAILVDTKKLGKEVITALVDYNTTLPPEVKKIEFISEESLLVSSAEAVGILVSVLEKMAGESLGDSSKKELSQKGEASPAAASNPPTAADKKGGNPGISNWNEIRCNFSFYALRHPELSAAQQISGFLKEDSQVDAINAMLGDMQTVALPALVEAITENFVPEHLRRSQAVFIAAFQDMVLEYCERSSSDLASFLEWWKAKGSARSISSPEGTDALEIMTIHKSKGLEFKCVILPFAKSSFVPTPHNAEWKWVKPADCFSGYGLPPYVPVETRPNLEATVHDSVYRDYYELHIMDKLNSAYVAFTRAAEELYIFTKKSSRKGARTFGGLLKDICGAADEYIANVESNEERGYMLPPELSAWNDDFSVLSFGEKREVAPGQDDDSDKKSKREELLIEEYGVDSSPAILHYVEQESDDTSTLIPEASDTDPRSDGNLLHAVMAHVKIPGDLPRAFTAMKMKGMITTAQAEEWQPMLSEAIRRVEPYGWYAEGWRVLNERDIIFPRHKNRRPDRILISPDRKKAVIIDYKFGGERKDSAYLEQVRDYVSALYEALRIPSIEGFVWYVRQNHILKV